MITKRQAEVLGQVIRGLKNSDIGDNLYITEKTVKFHLTRIYKVLGITTRLELVTAYHNNELHPDVIKMVKLYG